MIKPCPDGPWINTRNITFVTTYDNDGNDTSTIFINLVDGKTIHIKCITIEAARVAADKLCSEINKHDSVA